MVFILSLVLLLAAFPWNAAAEITLRAGTEQFSWREYVNGQKVVEESGHRGILGFSFIQDGMRGFLLGYSGKAYANVVDYSGQTQTGVPVSSTTSYTGMLNDLNLHFRFAKKTAGAYFIDAVVGGGIDFWTRNINGTYSSSLAASTAGYTEEYLIGYARVGLNIFHAGHGIQGGGGLKYPVYTWEKANLKTAIGADTDPVLSPGKELSYYASIGWRFNSPWSITLGWDSYRFGQSDPATFSVGSRQHLGIQPDSQQDIYYLTIGYSIFIESSPSDEIYE